LSSLKKEMLVVCTSVLLLIGNAASKISLKDIVDEFEVYKGSLKQAGHLEGRKLSDLKAVLKEGGHNGVVLDIQNFSGLRLVDPAVSIYCTALHCSGWADPKFGELHPIDPTSQDAFAFHNKWIVGTADSWHSTGVASWLVLKPNGSPFTYYDNEHGREYEIRLWVYWENTNWYCSEHKPARVAVEFFGNSHDEDQSLAKEYYNAYFKELKGRKEKIRSTAKSHKGQGLMAEVEAQSECNPRVTVKLASKRYKSHQVVGDNYEGVEPEQSVLVGGLDSASVWSYLLIGLLGLAAVAFACCCYTGVRAVLKRGREARYGKKRTSSQGGVYTGVPTHEPDREAFSDGEQEVDPFLKLDPEKPKVARGEAR